MEFRPGTSDTFPFLHSGKSVINLNNNDASSKRVIPCPVSFPYNVPELYQLRNGTYVCVSSNSSYNPAVGFTVSKDILPTYKFKCCFRKTCVSYAVEGKTRRSNFCIAKITAWNSKPILGSVFYVLPNCTTISARKTSPVIILCQGSDNLIVTLTSYPEAIDISTISIDKFNGGPSIEKQILIGNITRHLNITCSDGDYIHSWEIVPEKAKGVK